MKFENPSVDFGAKAPELDAHVFGDTLQCFIEAGTKTACTAAGVPGRILHDFRRTAVRNLERAGVSRSAAMAMVGHKTESIYRRHAIVDEAMQHEAAAKIDIAAGTFSGTVTGNQEKAAGGHSS